MASLIHEENVVAVGCLDLSLAFARVSYDVIVCKVDQCVLENSAIQ